MVSLSLNICEIVVALTNSSLPGWNIIRTHSHINNHDVCKFTTARQHAGQISDEMLCAGAPGKDACQANHPFCLMIIISSNYKYHPTLFEMGPSIKFILAIKDANLPTNLSF